MVTRRAFLALLLVLAVAACGRRPVTLPKFETLCDDFSAASVDTTLWHTAFGGALSQSGGQLTATSGVRTLDWDNGWTLGNSDLAWEMVWNSLADVGTSNGYTLTLQDAGNSLRSSLGASEIAEIDLYFGYDASVDYGGAYNPDSVALDYYYGPSSTFVHIPAVLLSTSDLTNIVRWRIRDTGTNVVVETSPDGSTWTTRFTLSGKRGSTTYGMFPTWVKANSSTHVVLEQVGQCVAPVAAVQPAFCQVVG